MVRVGRLLQHRWLDTADARRLVDDAALARLRDRVTASEARHTGQIRLCVEASLPLSYLWRDAPARERALSMFAKLRVWDTEHNNGVLIYLLVAEHAIEIVADRGVDRRVGASAWQWLTREMSAAFAAGRFEEGLVQAVDAVDALLRSHFPREAGSVQPNELPDDPVRL